MPSDAGNSLARSHRSDANPEREGRGERAALRLEVSRLSARVAELERDYARLERFVAVAAHEMAEPLVTTETYATLVLERLGGALDPESRSDLEALSRAAARLRLMVEALLHEARSESALQREPVELSRVVDECVDLLRHEIHSREVRIVGRGLPSVMGEPSLLATVVKNLLSNALRYGPRSGGTIRIDALRTGPAWRISVVSEGAPISPEDQERIFAPFERGPGERRSVGAGLGLAISREIVERHGGVMGVESGPGGNRFFFTIPD